MNVFRLKQTFMDSIAISTFRVMLPIVNFKIHQHHEAVFRHLLSLKRHISLLNEHFKISLSL